MFQTSLRIEELPFFNDSLFNFFFQEPKNLLKLSSFLRGKKNKENRILALIGNLLVYIDGAELRLRGLYLNPNISIKTNRRENRSKKKYSFTLMNPKIELYITFWSKTSQEVQEWIQVDSSHKF
eukprot:TRINITY_DN1381_c0_g1_i1.p1 TRINITY_DN1381_c0_g1~~TRINITY_DN1381_c0_g1_i1.p1  ORF type:complete len:124 (-),score=22.12 TRINITY_DN1381_c0_g1_i1:142-513(-)